MVNLPPPAVRDGLSRALLRTLPGAAFFLFDRELRFVFAEGDGLLRAGFSPDRVEGRPLVEVLDGTPYASLAAAYENALQGERSQLDVVSGEHTHNVRIAPVRGDDGRVVAGMVLSVDVTGDRRAENQLRELDRMRRRAMESSPIGMSLTDPSGRFLYVNPALQEQLGRRSDELVGIPFTDVVHPDDRGRDVAALEAMNAGLQDQYQTEKRYLRPDGSGVHVLVSVSVLRDAEGRAVQFFTQAVDLTERKRSEQEARRRATQQSVVATLGARALEGVELPRLLEEAAAAVASTLELDLVSVLEARPGGNEVVVRAAIGFDDDLIARAVLPVRPGGRLDRSLRAKGPLVTEDLAASEMEASTLERHGVTSSLSVCIGERDQPFGLIGAHSRERRSFSVEDADFLAAVANLLWDAIARRRAEERIRHQALHDGLTGLPNRTLVRDRLQLALQRAERTGRHASVLVVDVDNFQLINDSLGHAAGDELLKAIASRLQGAVRPGDTVARLGGDEFVVLCEDVGDVAGAERVARRLSECTACPFEIASVQHRVEISIGVALADASATAESLLRDADAALHRAKERGRARHELFEATIRDRTVARLNTEAELRSALVDDQLRVYYQPYFELSNQRLVGMEALVRWAHPKRGLVPPSDFIPIAEQSDLIVEIGEWVLGTAARQLAAWRDALSYDGELCVSINVSARQLCQPGLERVVANVLQATGLPPQTLALELTETGLIDGGDQPEVALAALKRIGVMVVLDDFGTGYSSLSHLQRFPIDVLKIDRSFIDALDAPTGTGEPIVRAIMGMAESLGIRTIAEGVETSAQLDALRGFGAAAAQGYYFAKPLPADQMRRVLNERFGCAPPTAAGLATAPS
jgi:diguanylate cyclase (GGDEF)-like protein/PAS domain S-box-containing protein